MFDRIHQWSHLVLKFSLLWDFFKKITDPISLLVMSLLRFYISFWVCFGRLCASRNLFISSRFSNLLVIIVYSLYSLIIFISVKSVVMCLILVLILVTWVSLFLFLVILAKRLSILLIFSKNQFWSHWF